MDVASQIGSILGDLVDGLIHHLVANLPAGFLVLIVAVFTIAALPEAIVAELKKRGHEVTRVRVNGGGYQGILIDPKTNVLHGGSEVRKDGMAVGY